MQFTPVNKSIIEGCLKGNRMSQRMLYDHYKMHMYNLAYRMTGEEDMANDILQDTFINVFRNLDTVKNYDTLGFWIRKILIRVSLARMNYEKRYESFQLIKHDRQVEWQDSLTGELLWQAIRELPHGYRLVFTLIEVEGMTHKEVGEILGISEGTSKSQLFHAKRILQENLSELDPRK